MSTYFPAWQEWFQQNDAIDLTQNMSDEVQLNYDSSVIKVYCERKPDRERRHKLWGRLKAVAKHEFGVDAVCENGHPEYEVMVNWEGSAHTYLFGRLDRYGDDFVFGKEALSHLGWTAEQASARVHRFHF